MTLGPHQGLGDTQGFQSNPGLGRLSAQLLWHRAHGRERKADSVALKQLLPTRPGMPRKKSDLTGSSQSVVIADAPEVWAR